MDQHDDTTDITCNCPDCGKGVQITMVMLERPNKLVVIGTCTECNDGKTIKGFMEIPKEVFANAAFAGLPILKTERKAS